VRRTDKDRFADKVRHVLSDVRNLADGTATVAELQ
jgi:hypothetical protein